MTDERVKERIERDLMLFRNLIDDRLWGTHPIMRAMERACERLESELTKLVSQETLLLEGKSFDELFGPAAIDMATIDRVAEAALGALIAPKPDFFEPTPDACQEYSDALLEFCDVCSEKTILALAYLARGVLLSEINILEFKTTPVYMLLPDGTPVRLRTLTDMALQAIADQDDKPEPAPRETMAESRRMVRDAIRIQRDSEALVRKAERDLEEARAIIGRIEAQLDEQTKTMSEMGDRIASGSSITGGRGGRG